jgi:limonene-1,2-epoxide hydrolase
MVGTEVALTPEEVVRAELAAWDRLDVGAIMSFFTRDAVWDNVPFGAVTGYDEAELPDQVVGAAVLRVDDAEDCSPVLLGGDAQECSAASVA